MRLFTLISALILSFSVLASNKGKIAVISNAGEKFYLILNDEFYNQQAKSAVLINGTQYQRYRCTIVDANNQFVIEKSLTMTPGMMTTYTILNRRGRYQLVQHSVQPLNSPPRQVPPFEHVTPQPTVCPDHHHSHDHDMRKPIMTQSAQQRLVEMIKNESFSSGQLSVAKQAAHNKRMTVQQIKEVAELFSFSDVQLQFVKSAYQNCINKADYYELIDVFTFSSDKRALQNYISTNQ